MAFPLLPAARISLHALSLSLLVLVIVSGAEAKPNFTDCAARFLAKKDNSAQYVYSGVLYNGILPTAEQRKNIISLEGCNLFCGAGIEYYPWKDVSKTITTWVLPVIGLLLQSPFEANQFRNTLYALVRWLGSPIASLSYILWNIKVIGKAALLVDMAKECIFKPKLEDIDVHLRDSLYILTVMNQYSIKPAADGKQAVQLLRIALFAKEISSPATSPDPITPYDLEDARGALAKALREGRKRGVVPVFITLMWFIFSLAISIQDAFGDVGGNAVAHDLALGLLLSWLPVLIVSAIVDRNPVLSGTTRNKLNEMLLKTQLALQHEATREKFCSDIGADVKDFAWLDPNSQTRQTSHSLKGPDSNVAQVSGSAALNGEDGKEGGDSHANTHGHEGQVANGTDHEPLLAYRLFEGFAGQGRVRWHYGVAHPIIAGIESQILAKPRPWLSTPDIRKKIICGPERDRGLYEFDAREFWEILSALCIVAGTVSGAFVISFRTPTVGLGCRSGGYVIFGTLALSLFALEMLLWVAMDWRRLADTRENHTGHKAKKGPTKGPAIANRIFRVGELINTAWLIYIVMAQTIGSYKTCACQSSNWGRWGGYIDMSISEFAPGVIRYWMTGAILSCVIMFVSIAFLVVEWCEQSHLNSEDINQAVKGLGTTRYFKKYTLWIRKIPNLCIYLAKRLWHYASWKLHITAGEQQKVDPRQGIVWCERAPEDPGRAV